MSISPKEELIKAIQDRINQRFAWFAPAHGRYRAGTGGGCRSDWANSIKPPKELGSTVELLRVTDAQEMTEYGVPNRRPSFPCENGQKCARVPWAKSSKNGS